MALVSMCRALFYSSEGKLLIFPIMKCCDTKQAAFVLCFNSKYFTPDFNFSMKQYLQTDKYLSYWEEYSN